MKKGSSIIGLLILLVLFISISGCTDNTQNYGTSIYEGKWKVDTSHFGNVSQEIIDAFSGTYKAYQNGTTITLIGNGKQISVQNDTQHQIKIVFIQDGANVNTTYYLDSRLAGYSYTTETTTDQLFDNIKKTWEMSRTTTEEQLTKELNNRTQNVKL